MSWWSVEVQPAYAPRLPLRVTERGSSSPSATGTCAVWPPAARSLCLTTWPISTRRPWADCATRSSSASTGWAGPSTRRSKTSSCRRRRRGRAGAAGDSRTTTPARAPRPLPYAVSFDPEALKFVALELLDSAGVELRLHTTFVDALVEDSALRGGIFETKSGREAILASAIIDASGDGDVFACAGAPFELGTYIMTVVHRFANVDVERAIDWERAQPEEAERLNREIKAIYGSAWDYWWLRTTIDGVVWCNCPHIPNLNALRVEDQTYVEHEARRRIFRALDVARANLPGFERAQLVDTAPQLGVRQTRLLQGEYVLTKQDVLSGRWFEDRIGRGRDYYYPYRTLLPRGVDNLLVAGRCFSATSEAQKMSREIPPMMVVRSEEHTSE